MKQITTIVLSGGGSGGHITPLLPLARELKKADPDCRIVYIGYKGDNFESLGAKHSFDKIESLRAGKFRRYHSESFLSHLLDLKTLLLNLRDFFRVIFSVAKAYRLLGKYKPDVVFSKGGFVVVPVGIAARLRQIPIVTHDSDAVPGLANKIVSRWAVVNATGMPIKYYPYPENKAVFTGIPINERIKPSNSEAIHKYKSELKLAKAGQVLMVAGGGNGSKKLNDLMLNIAPQLMADNPDLYIVHITGVSHEQSVSAAYSRALVEADKRRVLVMGFTPELYKYSAIADLIISRAGATALAEFAAAAKACIIIPSPFLAAGHQLKNAEELEESQAAVVVDNDAGPEVLLKAVSRLLADDAYRHKIANNFHQTVKSDQAAAKLAWILLKVARGEYDTSIV